MTCGPPIWKTEPDPHRGVRHVSEPLRSPRRPARIRRTESLGDRDAPVKRGGSQPRIPMSCTPLTDSPRNAAVPNVARSCGLTEHEHRRRRDIDVCMCPRHEADGPRAPGDQHEQHQPQPSPPRAPTRKLLAGEQCDRRDSERGHQRHRGPRYSSVPIPLRARLVTRKNAAHGDQVEHGEQVAGRRHGSRWTLRRSPRPRLRRWQARSRPGLSE